MRWDAIIKENRQHGVRSSGKSEAGEKVGGVKRTPPYHTITLKLLRRANAVKNRSSKY